MSTIDAQAKYSRRNMEHTCQTELSAAVWHHIEHILDAYNIVSMHFWQQLILKNQTKSKFGGTIARYDRKL